MWKGEIGRYRRAIPGGGDTSSRYAHGGADVRDNPHRIIVAGSIDMAVGNDRRAVGNTNPGTVIAGSGNSGGVHFKLAVVDGTDTAGRAFRSDNFAVFQN
ncbi:hypothetical protein D3C75_757190 [compost metagenome]